MGCERVKLRRGGIGERLEADDGRLVCAIAVGVGMPAAGE